MAGLNKVMLIGRLGDDPKISQTQDGRKIAQFSLATSDTWKDKSTGEKREKTQWHRIVIFNDGLAGVGESYVKKGSQLYIEGQLQTRKYTDNNGVEKWTTEVVLSNYSSTLTMLGGKGTGSSDFASDSMSQIDQSSSSDSGSLNTSDDLDIDDEIPF